MAPFIAAGAAAALVVLVGVALAAVWDWWNSRRWAHIPGPKSIAPFRSTDLGPAPHVKAAEYAHKYGPVYTLHLGRFHAVVVTDPVILASLLGSGGHGVPTKFSELYSKLPFMGTGKPPLLYTEDEADWNCMRQHLKHPFSISNMRNLFPKVAHCAKDLADFVKMAGEGEVLAMDELFRQFSLSVLLGVLFDTGIDGKKFEMEMSRHMSNALGGMAWPSKSRPASNGAESSEWLSDFFQFMAKLIQSKSFTSDDAKKQLWAALAAVNESNGNVPDLDTLKGQLACMFVAGYDSTAAALGWSLYQIATHPDVDAQVAKELKDARIAEKVESNTLSYADVSGLQYLYFVILETLRLNPPNPTATLRKLSKDTHIGKYLVPKGTVLWVPIYAVHRSMSNWERPDDFDPSRWETPNAAEGKRGGKRYIPFMSGPKNCLGQTLAIVEIRTALAILLCKHSFRLAPGMSGSADKVAVLRRCLEFDGGLRMSACKREKAAS